MIQRDIPATPSQRVGSLAAVGLVATALSLGCQGIGGQTTSGASQEPNSWTAPKTPDGQPDLQGVWSFSSATPLERPPELAGKEFLTPEEAAKYGEQVAARVKESRKGQDRYNAEVWDEVDPTSADWTKGTALITDPRDGRLPPITPQAEKRRAERQAALLRAGGPEDLSLQDRCILSNNAGPPMLSGVYNNNVQVLQSRDVVVLYNENIHLARIVPLDGRPPLRAGIRKYPGDSLGRWEQDTLIVETTNFTSHGIANFAFRRQSGGTDENLHLIERFTRTGADTLEYEITLNDPTVWTRPWSAALTMRKIDERIYEYACHEGNYGLRNMLEIARAAEKAAAKPAQRVR